MAQIDKISGEKAAIQVADLWEYINAVNEAAKAGEGFSASGLVAWG